jgi:hypothetical protein
MGKYEPQIGDYVGTENKDAGVVFSVTRDRVTIKMLITGKLVVYSPAHASECLHKIEYYEADSADELGAARMMVWLALFMVIAFFVVMFVVLYVHI